MTNNPVMLIVFGVLAVLLAFTVLPALLKAFFEALTAIFTTLMAISPMGAVIAFFVVIGALILMALPSGKR